VCHPALERRAGGGALAAGEDKGRSKESFSGGNGRVGFGARRKLRDAARLFGRSAGIGGMSRSKLPVKSFEFGASL